MGSSCISWPRPCLPGSHRNKSGDSKEPPFVEPGDQGSRPGSAALPVKVFLLALPLQEPQRHLTLKLPTAGLIPLSPKVCHPLREQHQHSLITQPDTGQSSEVYISHTHHPTHPIHHHSPEPPPHSSSWSVLSFLSCPYHHLSLSDSATAMPDSNIHPLK